MKGNFTISTFLILIVFSLSPTIIGAQTFAKGADIGWLSEMEASGRKFYNSAGAEQDLIQILKDKGINSIRLRVWVNPATTYSSTTDVVNLAVRAKNMGMRILIDFHYSDSWADPGKQNKPAAWVGQSFNTLLTSVYNHTFNVLTTLKANGVTPEWVQVGNETNNGMLWEDGKASVNMANFAKLVSSGYDAVKAVSPTSKVIVHISNGYDNALFRWMFDGLTSNNAKWDVIGMSLYPTQSNWSTLNSQCLTNMNDMVARYNKEVMMCEIGMDVGPSITAKKFIADLITKTKSVTNNKGLGVFYWEPEAYNRWQGYGKGAFDMTGKPTAAMDAFLETTAPNPTLNYIVNPGFDVAATQTPTGWSESGSADASYTSAGNGWNANGAYYLNHYQASAYQVRTFQTVTVPNGRYSLAAWAIRGSGQNVVQMYASGFGGSELTANIPVNDAWSEVRIPEIEVINGQLTIGFYSDANAGNWLNVDSVTLVNASSLPVSIISFNAALQSNGQVKLTWKTAFENDNKNYIVQRSSNGTSYKNIGTIKSIGDRNIESSYEFIDAQPEKRATNYYRLMQEDNDGKTKILGVKLVNVQNAKSSFTIYPNPATRAITIEHSLLANKKVSIQIAAIDGKKVFTKSVKALSNNVTLELPVLPSGQYYLSVVGDGINETQKINIRQ